MWRASHIGTCAECPSVRTVAVYIFLLLYAAEVSPQTAATSTTLRGPLTVEIAAAAVLSGHPLLTLQEAQVLGAEGVRLQTSSAFDTQFFGRLTHNWLTTPLTLYETSNAASPTFNGNIERAAQTSLISGFSRAFRSGISFAGTLELDRVLDNISSRGGNDLSLLNLTATLPLLRNRGRSVVDAQEHAAILEVNAARDDASQRASQLVQTVTFSFWSLVASQQNLVIAQSSESRSHDYLSNVQVLAGADQVPQNDLNNVKANLAQRTLTRIAAEQAVIAAQQQLTLDMGLALPSSQSSALIADGDFPSVASVLSDADPLIDDSGLLTLALSQRDDFTAALKRIDEQKALLHAASNRLQPQLDLSANAGYAGLQSGRSIPDFFEAAANGVRGPNAGGALTFSFPPRNEAARGALLTSRAALLDAESNRLQLSNQITAQVNTARSALGHAARQVIQADRAVTASLDALNGEREKYRVGMGSIIDLVTVEDRVNTAQLNQVQSHLLYAVSLAQLRYATGSLVRKTYGSWTLQARALTELPSEFLRSPSSAPTAAMP